MDTHNEVTLELTSRSGPTRASMTGWETHPGMSTGIHQALNDVLEARDRIGEFPKLWSTHTLEIVIISNPPILPFSNESSHAIKQDDS
jgi:hypothetical protein